MKVLQICNKSPWPPVEGGPIAMHQITQGLLDAGVQVMVMAVNTPKHYIKIEQIPEKYKQQTQIQLIDINTNVSIWGFVKSLFSVLPYHVSRFWLKNFENKLIETLLKNEFDVIQLETMYMSPYLPIIRKYSKAKIILRAHNIEFLIWERLAKNEKNIIKKLILIYLSNKLKKYETKIFDLYDNVVAITQDDADVIQKFVKKTKVTAIPFGIKLNDLPKPIENNNKISFFHIGSMNWKPNEEGIKWLLNEVWEKFYHKFPDVKLYLAGRHMSDSFYAINKSNVEIVGEVSNAYAFMQQHGVLVAPLFSGSGMRIKIIEAMAIGKCVITTTIGAEGILYTDKKNILIANTPDEFIEAMIFCVKNTDLIVKIGEAARKLIIESYNSENLIQQWLHLYRSSKLLSSFT